MKYYLLVFLLLCTFLSAEIFNIEDNPNDDGTALKITWNNIPNAALINITRIDNQDQKRSIKVEAAALKLIDKNDVQPNNTYKYIFDVRDKDNNPIFTEESKHILAKPQWFNTDKILLLIMTLAISAAILYFILSAKIGKELYIRKIGGLESIDEAVGRATELGQPVLYIPGTLDIDDMQTIAGLTILGKVAQKAAEYDTDLIVPVSRSMVLSTAREIVKESYMKAGRPDAYKSDSVFYLTDDQFGFVAGVDGIIIREKPAANFYLGAFYAESLILAETGFASGAIQTAGTAMPSQLPFFVAACDYTLIGEELFAASAYLSQEPNQLGSLKGQDFGKALFVIIVTIGVVSKIIGINWDPFLKFLHII